MSRRSPGRRRILLITLSVLVVTVFGIPAGAHARLSYGDRITTRGLGPVEIGMTISQASDAVGREIEIQQVNEPCGGGVLSNRFRTSVLTTGDIVTRIYIGSRAFRTRKNVGIGTSERTLRRRYGRLLVAGRNFYTREPQYEYRRGNRRIVFDTNKGRVRYISVGRLPEILYVEGCL